MSMRVIGLMIKGMDKVSKFSKMAILLPENMTLERCRAKANMFGPLVNFTMVCGKMVASGDMAIGKEPTVIPILENGTITSQMVSVSTPGQMGMSTRASGRCALGMVKVVICLQSAIPTWASIALVRLKVTASTGGKMAIFTLDSSTMA